MKINGNLQFNADGSGVIQNAFIEQFATNPTGVTGRIYYNTTTEAYFYYNGTTWLQLATGSSAVSSFQTSLQGLTPSTATTGAVTLAGTLGPTSGGTGFASYTIGNLLYADSTTSLAKLAPGTATQVLHGGTTPSWAALSLTTDVTGVLPLANGGTNAALTATAGGLVYGTGTALAVTAAGTAGQFVLSGGASAPTFLTNSTPIDTDGAGTVDMIVGSSFNVFGTANEITTTAVTSPAGVTLSIPSTFIAPGTVEVTSNLTIDGLTYESAQTGITAHAGGGQGSATALTKSYNVVTTVASPGDSVKLPASGVGLEITVANIGTNALAVFPQSGDQIDGGAVNASVTIPAGGTATYQSVNSGNWYTIDPVVVSSGAGLSVTYSPGETVLSNTGVTSFSGSTTGLTPSSATTGAVVLGGVLNPVNGGTGIANSNADTITLGGSLATTGGNATFTFTGTTNVTFPTSGTLATTGGSVASFQTSLSGLTPSTATTGAVTLAGTLGVASGGTGDVTLTTNGVLVGAGTSPVTVTAAGSQYNVFVAGAAGVPGFGQVNLAQSAAVTGLLALTNGGTNANLTAVAGAPVYSTASALALGTAGTAGQAYISGGTSAPTWQSVASTVTTNQIIEGDGTGAFVANGATFVGSGSFSGVTLSGTVTGPTDAATKAYVDAVAAGLSWKAPVKAIAVANGTLATAFTAGTVIDGYTLVLGDRLLLAGQTTGTQNGIYIVTAGTPTRSTDMALGSDADNSATFVENGTLYKNSGWVETASPAIVGTNSLVFTQFSGGSVYTFNQGLTQVGSTVNVNVDGVTTYIDGSNNVAVDSSATVGQVLRSTGTAGTTATWGALDLTSANAVSGSLPVTHGGTGAATFTAHGVLVGEGTSAVVATAVGTTGQVLVGNTAADPSFATLSTIAVTTFSAGTTGLTPASATSGAVTLAGTLIVGNGGTGATTLTNHGVVIGQGTAAVAVTSAGTTGQVLTSNGASADPTFQTLSSLAVTSITGTANEITASAATGAVTLSIPSTFIAPGSLEVTTTSKFDGLTYQSTAAVSAAGTTQGTATAITAEFNVVTASAGNTGVILPTPAFAGVEITIVNTSAVDAKVYPATGGTIDGAGANNSITVPAGATWTGQASTTTQWYSIDPVVVNGTGISVTYSNGQTSISNTGVLSFSAGTTGLTPATGTSGNVTLAGTLALANGGTNASLTASAGSVVYSTASALALSAVGTSGYFLTSAGTSAPTWSNPATTVVTSFQTSLAGLTPSTATTGVVTLAGTLGAANGGTGVNNSTGAVGKSLVATSTGVFTATSTQFNYDSTLNGGAAEYFAVTHNLGQKYVSVQVYSQDTQYAVVSTASGGPTISVAGDQTAVFTPGTYFVIAGSSTAGNNKAYTVSSSTFTLGNTVITITGTVTSQGASGFVVVGPSQIIPQGIFLVDTNNVVVTLNASLDVFIVVTGVAGVALA